MEFRSATCVARWVLWRTFDKLSMCSSNNVGVSHKVFKMYPGGGVLRISRQPRYCRIRISTENRDMSCNSLLTFQFCFDCPRMDGQTTTTTWGSPEITLSFRRRLSEAFRVHSLPSAFSTQFVNQSPFLNPTPSSSFLVTGTYSSRHLLLIQFKFIHRVECTIIDGTMQITEAPVHF